MKRILNIAAGIFSFFFVLIVASMIYNAYTKKKVLEMLNVTDSFIEGTVYLSSPVKSMVKDGQRLFINFSTDGILMNRDQQTIPSPSYPQPFKIPVVLTENQDTLYVRPVHFFETTNIGTQSTKTMGISGITRRLKFSKGEKMKHVDLFLYGIFNYDMSAVEKCSLPSINVEVKLATGAVAPKGALFVYTQGLMLSNNRAEILGAAEMKFVDGRAKFEIHGKGGGPISITEIPIKQYVGDCSSAETCKPIYGQGNSFYKALGTYALVLAKPELPRCPTGIQQFFLVDDNVDLKKFFESEITHF